jgi:AcrR family transcriptional regulator
MSEDLAGKGDPLKTLQLLWGTAPQARRGPKPRVSLAELLAAAIAIADEEGLEAVSTRRVAEAVGISPMSIYTYVPGKDELLDLMLDAVCAELAPDPSEAAHEAAAADGWRARLERMARRQFRFCVRHPWVLHFATHRPVLGPNTLRAYDTALAAVDGLGLDELAMDRVVTLINDYVHGAARGAARERRVKEVTGMSDEEWWSRVEPFLETLDFSPYPVASRVGPVAGEAYGAHDPAGAFEFGLARVLDGLELLIARRAPGSAPPGGPQFWT